MRDKFSNRQHFTQFIERRIKTLGSVDPIKVYEKKFLEKPDGSRNLQSLRGLFTEGRLLLIPLMYSRGDDTEAMKLILDEAIDNYTVLCEEIKKYKGYPAFPIHDRHPDYKLYDLDGPISGRLSAYTFFCWCLCLGADRNKIKAMLPQLTVSGKDRLLDTVLNHYDPSTTIVEDCVCPETFGLLDSLCYASPGQREQIVKQHLDEWPIKIGHLNGPVSIGVRCTSGIRSRATLEQAITDHFLGYWAWEAALCVKLFGIDDASFSDHEFYPYDMVHFLD